MWVSHPENTLHSSDKESCLVCVPLVEESGNWLHLKVLPGGGLICKQIIEIFASELLQQFFKKCIVVSIERVNPDFIVCVCAMGWHFEDENVVWVLHD